MSTVNELHTAQVAEAFDSIAEIFESSLENEITRGLRQKTYSIIRSLVPAGASVLDINCGIGIDAVALAQEGYRVIGVDISPKMIQQALERANKLRVKNAEFLLASFEDLSPLSGQPFDLVLSNFGGLNCVASLDGVAKQVAHVTKPGGYFFAVVMPPVCLWETVAGVTRFNFRSAFRRLRKNVLASGFRGKTFSVNYHPTQKFVAAFRQWFDVQEIRGYNIFSPPPHATRFTNTYPLFSRWLEQVDDVITRLPVIRSMGDHYMVVLQRKN